MDKKYTMAERRDYHIKMSKPGAKDINGKVLTEGSRYGHMVKAGQLQNKMARRAKASENTIEYYKKNKKK